MQGIHVMCFWPVCFLVCFGYWADKPGKCNEKIISCMTPSFFLSHSSLPPPMPLHIAMHITDVRAVWKCMQVQHRPFTTVWAKGINHQLGFENHNQETAVATALQHNDKICRATWKRRTHSVSFSLCAIERYVNKHVHLNGFYCNNNFLAPLDFFFIFLRVITLIKALLHGTVKEKAYPEWACLSQNHYWMLQDLSWTVRSHIPHTGNVHTHTHFFHKFLDSIGLVEENNYFFNLKVYANI